MMFLNDVFGKYSFCMIFFGNICIRLVLVYVDFIFYLNVGHVDHSIFEWCLRNIVFV